MQLIPFFLVFAVHIAASLYILSRGHSLWHFFAALAVLLLMFPVLGAANLMMTSFPH